MKLSFIVFIQNENQHIDQCLQSIEQQSYENVEIICVHNVSSAGLDETLARHKDSDSRVTCLETRGCGPSFARNTGLDAANGDYILFVDADDFVDQALAKTIAEVAACTDTEVIMFSYSQYSTKRGKHELQTQLRMERSFANTSDLGAKLFCYSPPRSCLMAFKKTLLDDRQIKFDESLNFGEDLLFSSSALMLSSTVFQIHGRALYHRRKKTAHLESKMYGETENSLQVLKALEKLDAVRIGHDLPESYELAILNLALDEASYVLKMCTDAREFDSFYQSYSGTWRSRFLAYDRKSFVKPRRYDLLAEPETALEVLYLERAQLKEKNITLRKENKEIAKENSKHKRALKKTKAKLKKTRNSKAFRVGSFIAKPFRFIKKLFR